jgi:hypothetical protein
MNFLGVLLWFEGEPPFKVQFMLFGLRVKEH